MRLTALKKRRNRVPGGNFMLPIIAGTFLMALSVKAQDKPEVKAVADKACVCAEKIDGKLAKEKVIEEINSCIRQNSLLSQLTTAYDAAKKGESKEQTVILDENFKDIQTYLYKNCAIVQKLMSATDNVVLSKNKTAMTFYNEGLQYTNEKKYDLAVVSYTKAVKADPKFVTAWNYLGLNYRRLANYTEAIRCYKISLELDPMGAMPLQNMAIAYELMGNNREAAATYSIFISKHPDNPEGYFGAGRANYNLGEYAQGVDQMLKAYLLYKKAESPYVNDALENLKFYYSDLEKKGQLDIFKNAAKNNNINLD